MPRKPGGKYKGKIPRSKGEATIAAELEAKRRKAYEANLARLQERRAQDLLAEQGLQSEEEEAQALKLARLAQMFGTGKKGMLKKFWQNWKIGIVAMRREKAINERKMCWRKSCGFCDVIPEKKTQRHGEFPLAHEATCKSWWTSALDRTSWGQELHPLEAARDRPDVVNQFRACTCCGADTGLPGLGCRAFTALRDTGFMRPSEVEARSAEKGPQKAKHLQFDMPMAGMSGSMSTPDLRSQPHRLALSAEHNWAQIRSQCNNTTSDDAPEYDPTDPFVLSTHQAHQEERRAWSDSLSAMAGSPNTRLRSGQLGLTMLPPINTFSPNLTDKGEPLDEVAHWRTGQKTMLDKHMARMYVMGVQ